MFKDCITLLFFGSLLIGASDGITITTVSGGGVEKERRPSKDETDEILGKLESLLDVLSVEGLRQIPADRLLAGAASIFGGTALSQWTDPEVRKKAFALSEPSPSGVGTFVSHSWRGSRWGKYLALLLHRRAASAVLLGTAFQGG